MSEAAPTFHARGPGGSQQTTKSRVSGLAVPAAPLSDAPRRPEAPRLPEAYVPDSTGGARAWPRPAYEDVFRPIIEAPQDRPYVVAQLGQSLDGRIATLTGESRWINGDPALDHLHRLRAHVDAVVVGIGTAVADDPILTVRRGRRAEPGARGGRPPRPPQRPGPLPRGRRQGALRYWSTRA